MSDIILRPDQQVADAKQPLALSPADRVVSMMERVLDGGITADNVAAFKVLTEVFERQEDRRAESLFAAAFVALQHEIPKVQATKPVPDKFGVAKYYFAPFEEIDEQLRPLALKHGFTYSFAEGPAGQPGKITKTCCVQHIAGHKRSNSYSVRIGNGPPGATESQADASAHSYAKRGALCDAFSIVVKGLDNDARNLGATITAEQAEALRKRVLATGSDVASFLKYAQAKSFAEIQTVVVPFLEQSLKRKEKTT